MARAHTIQLNVRSRFARERAHELARATGMTATQVVEDALRAYTPPGATKPVGRLVRRGKLLVMPATGRTISLEDINAAIEAARTERE